MSMKILSLHRRIFAVIPAAAITVLASIAAPPAGAIGSSPPAAPVPSGTSASAPPSASAASCNHTGITHEGDGTFSFAALHVDRGGTVRDPAGCEVRLLGMNDYYLDEGTGLGDTNSGNPWEPRILSDLNSNIVRLSFNLRWWADNIPVPVVSQAGQPPVRYRDLLRSIVSDIESQGRYVILDPNTEFADPPCTSWYQPSCPAQDQGQLDYAAHCDGNGDNRKDVGPNPLPCTTYWESQLQSWQELPVDNLPILAREYGNDPAILFDVWNEIGGYIYPNGPDGVADKAAYYDDMNQRIGLVRALSANIIVVDTNHVWDFARYGYPTTNSPDGNGPTAQWNHPLYGEGNLLFDFHTYTFDEHTLATVSHWTDYLHANGVGVVFGEWGGNPGDPPGHVDDFGAYVNRIVTFAAADHVSLVYYAAWNLVDYHGYHDPLTKWGLVIAADYAAIDTGTAS